MPDGADVDGSRLDNRIVERVIMLMIAIGDIMACLHKYIAVGITRSYSVD